MPHFTEEGELDGTEAEERKGAARPELQPRENAPRPSDCGNRKAWSIRKFGSELQRLDQVVELLLHRVGLLPQLRLLVAQGDQAAFESG